MELVGPIFDVLKCLGDPTCRYINHHRKLEERMNGLQEREVELRELKEQTELRIKAQLRRGKIVRKEVEKWRQEVESFDNEMLDINQRVQNVSCFSRARLGKRVAQTVKQVERIIGGGGKLPEALVIDDPSIAGVAIPLEHLEGETTVKAEIWNYLMGDEIEMIGVCGMGGIGKITIMKHIFNQLLEETKGRFDKVIWVTVSKELNIINLQQDIAIAMKIGALPEPEHERAAILEDELEKRRHVLILDDVWKKFSLLEVGIPKPTLSNGSKLVLTSRSVEVCRSMDCEIVKVQPLSNEESMNLFLEHAGRQVLDFPLLKDSLGGIVEECDGLPLAIIVIAGSMKGIYEDHQWRNALRELREHVRSVKGTDEEIFERLKFSYDRLGDSKIQNCFLYCSLYPEDYKISKKELIEYWIDEGFLGTGSRQELYDRGHTILNRLENNCLLEKVGDRDKVKMHDVMRDTAIYIKSCSPCFMVKAGMGLKELPSKQEWKEDLEKVSLMMNYVSEIPTDLSPDCEILSTLLLQWNRSLQKISESFFQHMHGLKILDLSYAHIEQLPNSVSNLENLNSLVLRGCYKLRYVPSLEKLKALRKLDLCNTAIEKVPHGLEMLANLTYLNLFTEHLQELPIAILPKLSCLQFLVLYVESRTIKMNGFEPARLRKLETFEGRFNELIDFNEYCNAIHGRRLTSYLLVMRPLEANINVELLSEVGSEIILRYYGAYDQEVFSKMTMIMLKSSGVQSVSFHHVQRLLKVSGQEVDIFRMVRKLREIRHVEFLPVGPTSNANSEFPKKDVILSGCQIRREDPVVLPTDLKCLRILECHNMKSLSNISFFFQQTNELRSCSIHDCREIESVLDLSSSSSPSTTLHNLELLWLGRLENLRKLVKVGEASDVSISNSLPLPGIFSNLKSFWIEKCSNMKQLFPFELVHDLQNLKELVVGNCGQMEEIIPSIQEEENHKGKGTYSPTTFTLPKLRYLVLENLPELKSICGSNGVMTCDSLEYIAVLKCPNLKRMPLNLPLFQDSDQSSSCPLETIYIDSMEWWKSVEWDYPTAMEILQPWLELAKMM